MSIITKYNFYRSILFIYLNGYPETLSNSRKGNFTGSNLLQKFKRVLHYFLLDSIYLLRHLFIKGPSLAQNQNIIFYKSFNNYKALSFLESFLGNTEYLQIEFGTGRPSYTASKGLKLILNHKVIHSYYYLPLIAVAILRRDHKMLLYFDALYQYIGLYEEIRKLLKQLKPKSIFFSTDHDPVTRSVILIANELNIKTIYLQHASVSRFFPPLEFGLSLLEGKDAFDKYTDVGVPKGSVELIGMPKFEAYKEHINKKWGIETIGIAINQNDDILIIEELIYNIINSTNASIIYRFHPLDRRELKINYGEGRIFRSGSDENAFDFLSKIQMLVAGDSSIHLEATLMNVHSLYFKMSQTKVFDYYGYVKNDLCVHAKSIDDIIEYYNIFKDKSTDVLDKASYYNAAIESNFNSVEKGKEVITKYIS